MAIWKSRSRQDWCFEFRFRKHRYTGRGFKTRRDAQVAEHVKRKEVRAGKQTLVPMGFRELASIYLDDAERRFTSKTYKGKARAFRAFLSFNAGDITITEITPLHVDTFLKTLHSNNSYNVYRKELSTLFEFVRTKMKLPITNPCSELDKLPHTPRQKYIPSETDVLKLINGADSATERPLLMTLLHTAARIDEILRLKWSDVDFDRSVIRLWTRKRRGGNYEDDYIYMNRDLYKTMRSLRASRVQEEWVFYNEKTGTRFNKRPKFMKGLCKRVGIDPCFGFHTLRHFMASVLAGDRGVSTQTISKFLRHKNVRTTEIYLHSFDEAQKHALMNIEGRFNDEPKDGQLIPMEKRAEDIN